MVAIIDYGVGNLFSLKSSLRAIGRDAVVTGDAEIIKNADLLILPGVGAFGDAIEKLRQSGLDRLICEMADNGTPLMGICLGMQLLFDKSYEYGEHKGLGLIHGEILPLKSDIPSGLDVPHMCWNALNIRRESPILKYTKNGEHVYFVHSFYARVSEDCTTASAEYGVDVTASVQNKNVYGCQFHPEKSGEVGLSILRAFCELGDKI